jgi:hypothetical protein
MHCNILIDVNSMPVTNKQTNKQIAWSSYPGARPHASEIVVRLKHLKNVAEWDAVRVDVRAPSSAAVAAGVGPEADEGSVGLTGEGRLEREASSHTESEL